MLQIIQNRTSHSSITTVNTVFHFIPKKPQQITEGDSDSARIFNVRHLLIVTDEDLASLCATTVNAVNKAVLRNIHLFPHCDCFRMSPSEWWHIKNTYALPTVDRSNWLTTPLAFTDVGAVTLASVLNTVEAIRGSAIVWKTIEAIAWEATA